MVGRWSDCNSISLVRQHRLSGDVVEIDNVTHSVEDGEEEGSAGHDFVELNMGVQWDVLLDWKVLQFR